MKFLILFRLLLAALVLIGLGSSRLSAGIHTVIVWGNEFSPPILQISPGDSIEWVNFSQTPYTVTSHNNLWPQIILPGFNTRATNTFTSHGTFWFSCDQTGVSIIIFINGATPLHDECWDAYPLEDGVMFNMSTTIATSTDDPIPLCEPDFSKGVWFSYTPKINGQVTVDTCGSFFDTVLAVYAGDCGSLIPVANGCNNDHLISSPCSDSTAKVTFQGTAGKTYKILAGGKGGRSGRLEITATTVADNTTPENDPCFAATIMTPGVLYEMNTARATSTGDRSPQCADSFGKAVWYRYTPKRNGIITISTCGSDFDTLLEAYYGNCNSLVYVLGSCNNNNGPACSGNAASQTFSVTAGRVYRFMIGGVGGASGNLQVMLTEYIDTTPPSNDQCDQAIAMTAGITYSADTTYATYEENPPPECADLVGKGIWYTIVPPSRGTLTVSTLGSDFDTMLNIYTGSCGALTMLPDGCNDNNGPGGAGLQASLKVNVIAGQTYRIYAGGFGAQSGNLRIRATLGPPESWQEEVLPFDLGNSIAQADSNVVHFVDSLNNRLLSLDTDTGNFISAIQLQGKPSGLMAFSLDGKELYVPLHSSQKLQVITLAGLSTKDIVPLNLSPKSVSIGFDGMLYLIASNKVAKVNPVTGGTLGVLPKVFAPPIIKSNPSGTKIYVLETGLSGEPGLVDEFVVTPSDLPQFVTNHISFPNTGTDFIVAEDLNRIFVSGRYMDGIYVRGLTNEAYGNNDFGGRGVALSSPTNSPYIYAASSGGYSVIGAYDKITGVSPRENYYFYEEGFPSGEIHDHGMHVTPNGRIFYTRVGRRFGLIGAPYLSTNLPPAKEWIDAGTNLTVMATVPFTLQAVAPSPASGEVFAWSKIEGPDDALFTDTNSLSPSVYISTPGQYTFQVSRAKGSFVSRDRVLVTVTAKPIRILETSVDDEGRFVLLFDASPSLYTIEASTNLVDWETIAHAFNAEGQFTIQDPMTNRTQRFYRIRRTE